MTMTNKLKKATDATDMQDYVTKIEFCRWCRHVMPLGGRICTRCNSHQNAFFERAKHTITVATLVSFVVSAIVFIGPTLESWYHETYSQQTLKTVSFRSDRDALIQNSGKIPVFASHIETVTADLGHLAFFPIGKTVQPGQTILVDTKGLYSKRVEASEKLPGWQVSINAPDIMFENLQRDDMTTAYFAKEDFEYQTLLTGLEKDIADRKVNPAPGPIHPLNAKHSVCKIHYSSAAQGEKVDEFECVAVVATKGPFEIVLKDILE